MIEVGVRELKNNLSRYLRRVARGERIRVTMRGEPVAEILPAGPNQADRRLRELAADGRVTLPAKPLPRRPPTLERAEGRLASELILAEREEDG